MMHFSHLHLSYSCLPARSRTAQRTVPAADALVDANHYKRARVLVDARLRENPKMPTRFFWLPRSRKRLGNLRVATTLAEKSVEIDPGKVSYHAQLAECYAYTADRSTWVKGIAYVHLMKKEIAAALAIHPHDSDTLLVAMMFAFHAPAVAGGDHKKAHEIADEIVRNDPHWGYLAEARLAQEDSTDDRKEVVVEESSAGRSQTLSCVAGTGHFLLLRRAAQESGRDRARGHAMVALDPSQASGYAVLASAYARTGRWAELDAVLAQAEKAVPDDLSPYYQAAAVADRYRPGFARAEKYLARYMATGSGRPRARSRSG